jgi:hypothetical protein
MDSDVEDVGDKMRFGTTTGEVSSSSAMKEECVDELGDLRGSLQGSSKIESTADTGVFISVELCLM